MSCKYMTWQCRNNMGKGCTHRISSGMSEKSLLPGVHARLLNPDRPPRERSKPGWDILTSYSVLALNGELNPSQPNFSAGRQAGRQDRTNFQDAMIRYDGRIGEISVMYNCVTRLSYAACSQAGMQRLWFPSSIQVCDIAVSEPSQPTWCTHFNCSILKLKSSFLICLHANRSSVSTLLSCTLARYFIV